MKITNMKITNEFMSILQDMFVDDEILKEFRKIKIKSNNQYRILLKYIKKYHSNQDDRLFEMIKLIGEYTTYSMAKLYMLHEDYKVFIKGNEDFSNCFIEDFDGLI